MENWAIGIIFYCIFIGPVCMMLGEWIETPDDDEYEDEYKDEE